MYVAWTVVAGALGFALEVAAHGLVTNYTVDGVFYHGYYDKHVLWVEDNSPGPEWDTPGIEIHQTAFLKSPIFDSEFQSLDFICHRGATPGRRTVQVEHGSTIVFQWPLGWPRGHHGPVITMLANCNGPCEQVDKTKLKWNPIEKVGLIDPTIRNYTGDLPAGYWAADKLIDAGGNWTFNIPQGIAPGNYTLRTEIIALHNTYQGGPNPALPYGGQFYPNCFNLEITGSGTDPLASGTLAGDLYNINEPGLARTLWIFTDQMKNYTIPGPPVYTPNGASNPTSGAASIPTNSVANSPANAATSSSANAATSSSANAATSSSANAAASSPSNTEASKFLGGCGGLPPPHPMPSKTRKHPRDVQSF